MFNTHIYISGLLIICITYSFFYIGFVYIYIYIYIYIYKITEKKWEKKITVKIKNEIQ